MEGLGLGEGFFVCSGVLVCFSFLPTVKASATTPWRICPGLSPLPPTSLSLFPYTASAPMPVGEKAWATRGPGWGAGHPNPAVSKGRELKGGEDRERGRDAEERHQFSIPQWLQIFTLVFFPPLPSWKGEAGTSTSKGKLSWCLRGRTR